MRTNLPFGRVGEGPSAVFMRGGKFLRLLQAYMLDNLTTLEFQAAYRDAFLHGEERPDPHDELGIILHEMFEVLDRFTTDRAVIAADPEFFVTEKTVREEALKNLQRLRILNRSHS
jgi:hypothetical protein